MRSGGFAGRLQFDYRITLRFAPMLAPERVREMVEANRKARMRIRDLEESRLARPGKGHVTFEPTDEGREAAKEYRELEKSIQPIPDGHWGNVSVFVEPTDLGYARFLEKEAQQECEGVIANVKNLLTPYAGGGVNGQK